MKEFNYSPRCKNPYQGLSNCNSIARVKNDVTIYYSYAEPVAIKVPSHNITFMTECKWSRTTSKHQNWIIRSYTGEIKRLNHDTFSELVYAVNNKNVEKAVLKNHTGGNMKIDVRFIMEDIDITPQGEIFYVSSKKIDQIKSGRRNK